jgi:HSP20 family protein
MGFRRGPEDPPGSLPAELIAFSLRVASPRRPEFGAGEETDFPALDIYATPGELVVEAELPGVAAENVTVTAGEGVIVIEGVKEERLEVGRVNFLCMERSFGAFRRVVLLENSVNLDQARASCRAGVLQIRVPRVEEKRGRRREIPVNAEPTAE